MSTEPTIIYAARTLRDAYALRDGLAESGIVAVVLTDPLGAGPSRGFDRSVPAHVAVASADADSARHIAQVFDRLSAERPTGLPAAGSPAAVAIPGWPHCPECGTPRIARCPICETTGTHFNEADREFLDPSEFADDGAVGRPVATEAPSCGCGSAACSATPSGEKGERHPAARTEPDATAPEAIAVARNPDEPQAALGRGFSLERRTPGQPGHAEQDVAPAGTPAGAAPPQTDQVDGPAAAASPSGGQGGSMLEPLPLVLICPICDEPFVPRFARRCAWCGHQFADGFDYEPETMADHSEVDRRVVLMIAALVGLLLLLLAYFRYLI